MEEAREQTACGLALCDVLKISDNEILWFTGERDYDAGIRRLREQYDISLILLSMGKEGSRAYFKDLRVERPGCTVKAIETTGAGDTFCGCAIHGVLTYGLEGLTEENLGEILSFANIGNRIPSAPLPPQASSRAEVLN